jgi:hypothetical protein
VKLDWTCNTFFFKLLVCLIFEHLTCEWDVDEFSHRNRQDHFRNLAWNKSGRRVRLTILPPSVSRLPRKKGVSMCRNPMGPQGCYRESFTFYYKYWDKYYWQTARIKQAQHKNNNRHWSISIHYRGILAFTCCMPIANSEGTILELTHQFLVSRWLN